MKKLKFKDFVKLQRGFDLPKYRFEDGIYPVVGSTSILGFHNTYKKESPGVVTGRSGSLGTVQYIDSKYWPHNTALWVKDFQGNDPKYVFYFLKEFGLEKFNSGAGVPTLNRNHLDGYEIRIHEKTSQRKIASILSAYDDLIDNNTRRIKILEEMAQAIYKEWFVNFRFPGHEKVKFVESELGKIPEGWEVAEVKALVNRYKAGKKFTQKNVKSEGDVIVIDQSTDELLGYHNEEPDHIATPNKPRIIFGDHTCKMQLMVRPFSVGPNVIPFDSKNEVPVQFLFYLINSLVKTREYKRHWNELISKSVVLPIKELQLEFSKKIIPFFEAIEQYKNKNSNLRKTRDLLLPKLMSGEIDVEEMDIPINND